MYTWRVVATLVVCVQLSLAHYSLYITEEKLQAYYSNSVHSELVQGHFVEIVRDGEVRVGDDGSLLLSPVEEMGSGTVPNPALGLGGSASGYLVHSPSSTALPPLPFDVDSIDFTWVATTKVDYTLRAVQKGGQLTAPTLNVPNAGQVPQSPETLQLSVSCFGLSMKPGRVEVNLTTSADQPLATMLSVTFFFTKSCNDTVVPSLSTMFLESPMIQQYISSSPIGLSSSLLLLTSTPPHLLTSLSSSSPTLHPLPLLPTPSLSTPGTAMTSLPLTSSSGLALTSSLSFPPLLPLSSTPLLTSITTSSLSIFVFSSLPVSSPFTHSTVHSSATETSTFLATFSTPSPSTLLATFSTPSPSTLLSLASSSPLRTTISSPTSISTLAPSTSSAEPLLPHLSSTTLQPQPTSSRSFFLSDSTLVQSLPLSLTSSLVEESTSFSLSVSPTDSAMVSLSVYHTLPSALESTARPTVELVHSETSQGVVEPSSSVILVSEDPAKSDSASMLVVYLSAPLGGILLACILLACFVLLYVKCRARRKTAVRAFSDDPLDMVHTVPFSPTPADEDTKKKPPPPLSLWMSLPWGAVSGLPRSLQSLAAQLGVDRKNLSIVDTIVRGEYGSVVSGQLTNIRAAVVVGSQPVSIKMLTGFPEGSRRDEVVRFLEASTLMKGIQHRHILPVLHVSVEDNYVPLVIYPMAQYGDMYRVMRLAADPEHSVLPPLTTKLTLELAIQIASAMSYLADRGIVHPDLALRNCLLDSVYTVKISDGALAQQFYPECYYTLFGATRPVRWAAVETLQEGLCTVKSNVWSYAVTVWEIVTFAEMPYSEVNNNRSILSTIRMGAHLPRPPSCPEPLYELLCCCWKDRGEERPNFTTVVRHLQQLLTQHTDDISDNDNLSAQRLSDKHAYCSSSVGKSVSHEQLSHSGDSPHTRTRISHRETSQGRLSVGSMISRGSAADKLSVTFSVLSGDIPSGNNSEEEADSENDRALPMSTGRQEIHNILRQVSASFVDTPVDTKLPATLASYTTEDDTCSSINTAILSDISSNTLVPPTVPIPVRSPKLTHAADETSVTSSNPVSVTPPPSQTTDTHSKTSTMDLESVSTAPYSSSPVQSTSFLYTTTGYGVASSLERGDHSPLVVGHKARNSHSPSYLPSQPSAKSTDSGIRSDEDPETPNAYTPQTVDAGSSVVRGEPVGVGRSDSSGIVLGVSDLSNSLMAAFDSWDSTGK